MTARVHIVSAYFPLKSHPRAMTSFLESGKRLMDLPVRKTIWLPADRWDPPPKAVAIHYNGHLYPKDMFDYDDADGFWLKQYVKRWERETGRKVKVSSQSPEKDTLDYHAIQHQKTYWLAKTAAKTQADVVVWVDFGIFHAPGVDESVIMKFISSVETRHSDFSASPIEIGGAWGKGKYGLHNDVPYWRFCGSVLVCRGDYAGYFDRVVKDAFMGHLKAAGNVMWEVNIWALAEWIRKPPIRQYLADHDASMFTNYLGESSNV
jgi:hypothetical protein